MLENSEITEGHARTLLALQDADKIIEYANITVQKGLNVRQLEQAVKYASTEPKSDVPIPRQTTTGEFKDKIERLKNNYKLNVSVAASGKGLGVSIKGLEKWQVQLLLEYIDKHGDDLFTRE
jgi:ParB family chromosome partitioning protein